MIKLSEKNCSFFTLKKSKDSEIFKEAVSYPDLNICFVTEGSALWQINSQRHSVKPGDIIFLSDNQKRRFLDFGENGFALRTVSLDRRAFMDSYHFSFFLICISKINGVFSSHSLAAILEELYSELSQKKNNYWELASAKLTEFFIKAERYLNYNVNALSKYDKKMICVLDYIDSKITNGLSLSQASRFAGFTESSFSRWFAKVNGVSFKKYVMAKKIDRAMLLLETTDLKVVDIAYECGFDSISGFYDAFKKITGTTPHKITERHDV